MCPDRSNPRVTIGVPVYNGDNYVGDALASLVRQTWEDFEIVLSDNASTDGTEAICREYAARDPRVRYIRQPRNMGASWNFNVTIEKARGAYFRWHAHDDMVEPTHLERCVEALDRNPDAVLSYTRTKVIDQDNRVKRYYLRQGNYASEKPHMRFADLILYFNWAYEVFGLMRTDVLRQTDRLGNYSQSDEVLLGQLALRGKFVEVPEYLFVSREHDEQSIRFRADREAYMVWFDPNHQGQLLLPHIRALREFWRTVGEAPVSTSEKLCCYGAVSGWVAQQARFFTNNLVRAAVHRLKNGRQAA